MWRLLRMAFWIGVVIVLLPRAPQQTAPAPSVGVVDALSAATAALSDMSKFCARQPDACAAVSQLIVQFGHATEADAKKIHEMLNERTRASDRGAGSMKGSDQPL